MEQLTEFISKQYGLPSLQYVAPVDQGFLSQNHILKAGRQRLFLKQYRFTTRDGDPEQRVARIHRAKLHFANRGIPVILPHRDLGAETMFVWGEDKEKPRCYALFPYVVGIKTTRGQMSDAVLESAGEMLARMHWIGHNEMDIVPLKSKATFDPQPFWQKTAHILELIEQKAKRGEPMTEFDALAQESLHLKRALAEKHPPIFSQLDLKDDHLIHGDFHNDNFFVDEHDRVSHVFDWEQAKVTAREVEVLRSTLFMCLQASDDFKLQLSADNFRRAGGYLQSYHSGYPLETEMMAAAVENRFLGSIYSTWIEESHYLDNNPRVDLFLQGDTERLNYLGKHRGEFTEQLLANIES